MRLALVLLLAFAAGYFLRQPKSPPVRYARVVVPESVLVASKPDTVVRWKERIVYRTVRAEQVATAPKAALPEVESYCADYARRMARTDTVVVEGPPRLLLSAGTYDGRTLELWGPLSSGDETRHTYRARPPLRFTVSGDSVLVQGKRLWWADDLGRAALFVVGGYVLGSTLH